MYRDPVEQWIDEHRDELNHPGKHFAIDLITDEVTVVDDWSELVKLAGEGAFHAEVVLLSYDEIDMPFWERAGDD